MAVHKDLFGLNREMLISKSGVREVFTPHRPVQAVELFFGRQTEVQKLIEQINTPGQHALLYGDRGVGKSSLANIAAKLLLKHIAGGKLYTRRCDSSTTFAQLVAEPLNDQGINIALSKSTKSLKQGGKAGLKVPFASAGVHSDHDASETFLHDGSAIAPSRVAEILSSTKGLLLIDETDSLSHQSDKKKLAELVKLLSDNGSPFKLLIVGIAQTGEELTGGHPSVERCLKETRLKRMAWKESSQIVTTGADKLGLSFASDVVTMIVRLSAGYPHFTHLLALKCAEDAIADNRTRILLTDFKLALAKASEDAEGSLRRLYDRTVRSAGTEMYRTIVRAAATIDTTEFTAPTLREAIFTVCRERMTQQAMNNYLKRLVSPNHATILRRTAKGVYTFNDPRMQSYIRIANADIDDLTGSA